MTAWLTPDRKPIYAGTYFPARDGDRGASEGLSHNSRVTSRRSTTSNPTMSPPAPSKIAAQRCGSHAMNPETGSTLLAKCRHTVTPPPGTTSSNSMKPTAEPKGGPKFPSGLGIRFLPCATIAAPTTQQALKYGRRRRSNTWPPVASTTTLAEASTAMRRMRNGRSPHFEKMLYDNALLVGRIISRLTRPPTAPTSPALPAKSSGISLSAT